MKGLLTLFLCVALTTPVLAGPPANGTYTSTDIGGTMLPGRYSESYFPVKLSVNNTLNEQSWNGALGTQWHWYCPWVALPPVLLMDTVDGNGNGTKIWRVSYTGGYCWLDGAGPWAGGDASYLADITSWNAIVTETYSNHVEVGTIRNHDARALFQGYTQTCMSLSISNTVKRGDTTAGPLPAGYPDFWYWQPCSNIGTAGPGEWGDVTGITYSIFGCEPVATEKATWGAVKSLYRD
jgi:hypothetical protein